MSNLVSDLESYFSQYVPKTNQLIRNLEEQAQQEEIPIIGPVMGELLCILVKSCRAKRVLELGTAIGYSTIFLANACRQTGGYVISIDQDEEMVERARLNISKAHYQDIVDIRQGNATSLIKEIEEPVDFIFLDIDKGGYETVLQFCYDILKPGAMLVADNVAFQDAQSFNQMITSTPDWQSVHLLCFLPGHSPEKDGLCLALKKK